MVQDGKVTKNMTNPIINENDIPLRVLLESARSFCYKSVDMPPKRKISKKTPPMKKNDTPVNDLLEMDTPGPISSLRVQRYNSESYKKQILAEAARLLKKQREQQALLLGRMRQNVR